MALLGIHHIGIAVRNLQEATRMYADVMGTQPESFHAVAERRIRAALIPVGNSKLELIQPMGTKGVIAEFIKEHGEGVHHICFEVDDIAKELESLSARGVMLLDKEARQGITGKIAFIHPDAMNGVLVELMETGDSH